MAKGNASCHTPNDQYRERYDSMTWDSDKGKGGDTAKWRERQAHERKIVNKDEQKE